MRSRFVRAVLACLVLLVTVTLEPRADATAQTLPFSQNWSNTGLITTDDNWSGVPGIVGYRGDGLTGGTGVNPQTVLGEGTPVVDVNANQTAPNTFATGGVAEFHLADPVVALNGSGTARAPNLVITVTTAGRQNIVVSYNLRDLDGSTDNAVSPVALQYRVGTSGNFTNVPAGFVADATSGPSLATLVTPVSAMLPAAADNQPVVQVRIISTDAVGNDEWIGIDDISITGTVTGSTNPSGTMTANAATYSAGDPVTFTVTVTPGTNPPSTGLGVTADLSVLGLGVVTFFDDGVNGGDSVAGDNVFTFAGTIPSGLTGGPKSISATITDSLPRTATTPPISVTILAPTSPTGTGSAAPPSVQAGDSTTLTVTVTPGANPASTGITVTGDLSAIIPGATAQAFLDSSPTFTYSATVDPATAPGLKQLPITVADAQGRSTTFNLPLTVMSNSPVVISQIYGGGGNSGATYLNDYVQLFNRSSATVDVTGWTLQYASAAGTSWTNKQPIGGPIGPGQYYLVALASGGATGAVLPQANITGSINMSATTGKIALVDNGDTLTGSCPLDFAHPHVRDFVGYGTGATCHEGTANTAAPSNSTALFRKDGGLTDTDQNGADFVVGPPVPLATAPFVEIGPLVLSTDPITGASTAPRDATIEIAFTEPVEGSGQWFDVSCVSTGLHNDATTAVHGNSLYITPNVNFQPGEQCTVTIFKDLIADTDTDDSAPNTDHLPYDYVWSFTVATGDAPPYTPDVHLTMGNPTSAVADLNQPNNYLMSKPEYALSYNRDKGRPNWVSWHLTAEWFGTLTRVDTFRADPMVPPTPDWYRVQSFDFQFSGFDRGHMVPNADRDNENSIPINQATYLMSNMVAQAPDNNQGPWANFENYLRTLVGTRAMPTNEIYIVSGPAGTGGTGSNGGTTTTLANGHVTVPAFTWKVALVLPYGNDDVSRVSCAARTIAVVMPNVQGIFNTPWENFLTTVDDVEALTGYDFFSNVPQTFQNCIEAGLNGVNPQNQVITFPPIGGHRFGDADFSVDATASSGLPVAFTVVSGPATIAGNLVHLTGAGTVTIRAMQGGNVATSTAPMPERFAAAPPVEQTFVVGKALTAFSAVPAQTIEAGGASVAVAGTIGGNGLVPPGSVSVTLGAATVLAPIGPGGTFSATLLTASLAPGSYPITLEYAGDANFEGATTSSTLTVRDTTGPSIGEVSATPNVLGPPNHKMIDVFVGYSPSDITSAPVCALSVSSSEPANATGDGNTAIDWIVLDAHHVQLRAERSGRNAGRIYTITVTCTDGSGNSSSTSTAVSVPK